MTILFVNSNLYGHINPTLGLIKKLTDRGNKVSYFCSEQFSTQVTEAGASWIGFSSKLDIFLRDYRPTDRHPFFMLMEYMLRYDEAVLPEILDRLKKERYDLLICDAFFGGFCFLRQLIKIPIVCSHTSFAMSQAPVPERMLEAGFHPQLDNCYRILNRLSEAYKIKAPSLAQVFISKGDLNIVYTTRHFNGDAAVSEPDYLFAGPSVDRQQPASDLDFSAVGKRKLIYISLGSINTDFIDFYNMCISAFRDTEYYVCMSIGSKCEASQLGEIQANFLIRSFLPQLEILKRADAFITHAGFNSVNEALYYGVPMLALPQVNDQPKVARRIVEMQLGMMADIKELCPQTLKAKTEALMADHKIKENCMRVSQEMRHSAKLDDIAEQLERYTDAWQEVNINGAEK